MKTKLNCQNPFGFHPKGFLWETLFTLSETLGRPPQHFDFGAHDGSMLSLLSQTGVIGGGIGVDLNADVVRASQEKLPENVSLIAVTKNLSLEYSDESFDSVSIIGVLEHIHDQEGVLRQLHRILRRNGVVVVAVPGRHFFSFLDMGNYKFVFPRLHRKFYIWRHGKKSYEERYVELPNGLIGDIEVEKSWHQHFSQKELQVLLEKCGFYVTAKDGFGFFNRILVNLAYFLPGSKHRFLDRLINFDARVFDRAEIFVSAIRRPETRDPVQSIPETLRI
jgi:SAM-dependent methyltransferase